jgi:hypothetical protein
VSWKPIPNFQIDRSKPFPQYITNIRRDYLVDPGGIVTSVTLVDVPNTAALADIPSVPITVEDS